MLEAQLFGCWPEARTAKRGPHWRLGNVPISRRSPVFRVSRYLLRGEVDGDLRGRAAACLLAELQKRPTDVRLFCLASCILLLKRCRSIAIERDTIVHEPSSLHARLMVTSQDADASSEDTGTLRSRRGRCRTGLHLEQSVGSSHSFNRVCEGVFVRSGHRPLVYIGPCRHQPGSAEKSAG